MSDRNAHFQRERTGPELYLIIGNQCRTGPELYVITQNQCRTGTGFGTVEIERELTGMALIHKY